MTRVCLRCGAATEDFLPSCTTRCRPCLSEAGRLYRQRNREAIKARKLEWQRNNRDWVHAAHRKRHRSVIGWISFVLRRMRYDSKARGHPAPALGKEHLKAMTETDLFKGLWADYVASGFDKWKRPSIDRLDNSRGYDLDNYRLVTWRENAEAHWQSEKFKNRCREMSRQRTARLRNAAVD